MFCVESLRDEFIEICWPFLPRESGIATSSSLISATDRIVHLSEEECEVFFKRGIPEAFDFHPRLRLTPRSVCARCPSLAARDLPYGVHFLAWLSWRLDTPRWEELASDVEEFCQALSSSRDEVDFDAEEQRETSISRPRHRRGRKRRTEEQRNDDFFTEDVDFRDTENHSSLYARGRMDTLCDLPLAASADWVKRMGVESKMTTCFQGPSTFGIGGDIVRVQGILRNFVFTIRGKTFRRDVHVVDCLDGAYDLVLGASVIRQVLNLCRRAKSLFGGWFSRKKASNAEKAEGTALDAEQEALAAQIERGRQARVAIELTGRTEGQMVQQGQGGNPSMSTNTSQPSSR